MASWFEKGRPALFEALDAVCKQIDRDLSTELQKKIDGKEPQREVATRSTVSAEVQTKASDSSGTTTATTPDKDWKSEYAKLSAKFNALSRNFKIARDTLQRRKDQRDGWIKHAQKLEQKIRAAEEEHGICILDGPTRTTGKDNNETAVLFRDVSFNSGLDVGADAMLPPMPANEQAPTPVASEEQAVPGSTQSEAEPVTSVMPGLQHVVEEQRFGGIKEEPSSDGPVFVSERPVKKRKHDDDQEGARTPTAAIKTEPPDGSSPSVGLDRYGFNPHESPDLGEVSHTMDTPRKLRGREQAEQEDRQAEDEPDDSPIHQPGYTYTPTPLDAHRHQSRHTSPPPQQERGARRRYDVARGIADLAEDGQAYGPKRRQAAASKPAQGVSPAVKSRLGALLDGGSPSENDTPITRRHPGSSATRERDPLPIPEPRELPFENNTPRQGAAKRYNTPQSTPRAPLADATNTSRINAGSSAAKGKTSSRVGGALRSKPLSSLRLEDFKVNPAVNEGHDFAYTDVVRDKDERACLPGCVDMHCCGKDFRALALSQIPNPPLTGAQRQEEQKLLEEYLGDYAYRLTSMTASERAELWVEAKTRELANKYGRHRHRFSRMRSPPGFWVADFPSTQEIEHEREEAAGRERMAIQERHREATRPGGRWIFRDE
ncbi:DNA repair protein endonuclease SAE2/CtIP C-terminus [Geosmithia morbida]|uniref:DNA repair protein endonuclease SAE2/CtIP C-terminus n=1 Tax=Geosmithia morbida TaxID=1094350 RepID=A0A9P5D1L9_9HYPO|nr:DNA repair protein endonuclease SAE2/CtIP C-terminus [Geosmithia morbida]KAF4119960.1 DNA repair protein endonuclease SAE2/CtIP C-terminus [Geosmithia morbida]